MRGWKGWVGAGIVASRKLWPPVRCLHVSQFGLPHSTQLCCGRSLAGDLGLQHEGLVNPAEAASPLLTHTCRSSLPYCLVANQSLNLAQVPGEGP